MARKATGPRKAAGPHEAKHLVCAVYTVLVFLPHRPPSIGGRIGGDRGGRTQSDRPVPLICLVSAARRSRRKKMCTSTVVSGERLACPGPAPAL